MPALVDLTGMRFGRLSVKRKSNPKKGYHGSMWECVCECGNTTIVNAQNLKSGNTTSCGCYGAEQRIKSVKKHGETGTRLYRIWKAMHTRCYNEKSPAYRYYGSRGIRVCDGWINNFADFQNWSMSHGYRDNLTIDRIDVNGNYSPDNCRWVTMAEQNKNKRAQNGYKIKE